MCRKANGGTALAVISAKVKLRGECRQLKWYRSSPWGERGFCSACGSTLFWRGAGMERWSVSVGALACQQQLKIAEHIHIDAKPAFYDFADDCPRITGVDFTARALTDLQEKFGGDFTNQALAQLRSMHGDIFAQAVAERIVRS